MANRLLHDEPFITRQTVLTNCLLYEKLFIVWDTLIYKKINLKHALVIVLKLAF